MSQKIKTQKAWARVCKAILKARKAGQTATPVTLQNFEYELVSPIFDLPDNYQFGLIVIPSYRRTTLVIHWDTYEN